MSKAVLKVENISKQYRLGQLGTGTISHDLNRWFHKLRGKEDPYLKLGDVNDRSVADVSDYVWSLKDINFEVKQGEVLGIIGKNGAGKSTLLKILSQVTTPTTGQIKVKGRIAALLEVGTGFHPDLTGRENIFLNGAILGMTKQEIKIKLDEIIDFSGVAKYLDTPVKRYSSGMMVRLGFAVAAHLEPEILIVDEVLAVGDAEFQKKCLGKMKLISGEGRTILFVSHDMTAMKKLCNKILLLKNGRVNSIGDVDQVIDLYLNDGEKTDQDGFVHESASIHNTGKFKVVQFRLYNEMNNINNVFFLKEKITCEIVFDVMESLNDVSFDIQIGNAHERIVFYSSQSSLNTNFLKIGRYKIRVTLNNSLMPQKHYIYFGAHENSSTTDLSTIELIERFSELTVLNISRDNKEKYPYDVKFGYCIGESKWELSNK